MPFGSWAWPNQADYEKAWKAALQAFRKFEEDRAHGVLIVRSEGGEITITELVNLYLAHQHARTVGKSKEISAEYFGVVRQVTTEFRDYVGRDQSIDRLEVFEPSRPDDSKVVAWLNEQKSRFGWHAYNKRVTIISGLFTWAEHPITGVLRRPFRLKAFFEKREDKLRRREKRQKEEARGKQRFTAAELQGFFGQASNPVRAMLGLMYFAAFGLSDCSDLPQHAINWEPAEAYGLPKGWGVVNFQRPKTEIDRAAVLPPFVMDDLRAAIAGRPATILPQLENRVFLTPYGNPWVRDVIHEDPEHPGVIKSTVRVDAIGQEYNRLRGKLACCEEHGWCVPKSRGVGFRSDRKGVAKAAKRPKALTHCPTCKKVLKPMRKLGAYTFRHTAHTYASGVVDSDALALFEGHVINGVRRNYVEEIDTHKLYLIAQYLITKAEIPPDGGDVIKKPTQSESSTAESDGHAHEAAA